MLWTKQLPRSLLYFFSYLFEGRDQTELGCGRQRASDRGRFEKSRGKDRQNREWKSDHDAQTRGSEGCAGVLTGRAVQVFQGGRSREGHQRGT